MHFQPKTDEQIDSERSNLQPGTYDFSVDSAHDKVSKKARDAGVTEPDMIEVGLTIFTADGERRMKDWVMDRLPWKLKHFAYAIGCGQAYENGAIDSSELVGRCGKVELKMGKATEKYPARIEVRDYVVAKEAAAAAAPNASPRLPAASVDDTNSPPF